LTSFSVAVVLGAVVHASKITNLLFVRKTDAQVGAARGCGLRKTFRALGFESNVVAIASIYEGAKPLERNTLVFPGTSSMDGITLVVRAITIILPWRIAAISA
jgi:hypothetical protein